MLPTENIMRAAVVFSYPLPLTSYLFFHFSIKKTPFFLQYSKKQYIFARNIQYYVNLGPKEVEGLSHKY